MASIETSLAAETPPRFSTAAKDGFVVLEVGPEKQHYHLHKALLTHHSEYFRKALNGSWKEADDKLVKLEDVDPMAVDIFVHWLYTQKIPDEDEWNRTTEVGPFEDSDDDPIVTAYTKAFAFGDRFQAPLFKHAVNHGIVDIMLGAEGPRFPHCFTAMKYALENLPSNNDILNLFLDMHCQYWEVFGRRSEEATVAALLKKYISPAVMVRIMMRYATRALNPQGARWQMDLNRCDYHKHLNNEEQKYCNDVRESVYVTTAID